MGEMTRWNITKIPVQKDTHSMVLTDSNELLTIEADKTNGEFFVRRNLATWEETERKSLCSLASGGKVDNASLAYNCDSDTAYLLLGSPLQIYNANDLSVPLYSQTNPRDFTDKLGSASITFANNNSLFISTSTNGTIKFDIDTYSFTRVSSMYSPLAGHYYQVLNGKKYEFENGKKEVKITDLSNKGSKSPISLTLDHGAPDFDEQPMVAYKDNFYFWDCQRGIMKINLSGQTTTFVDLNRIDNALDFQPLFRNIRHLAVNQNGICVLGDPATGKILVLKSVLQ